LFSGLSRNCCRTGKAAGWGNWRRTLSFVLLSFFEAAAFGNLASSGCLSLDWLPNIPIFMSDCSLLGSPEVLSPAAVSGGTDSCSATVDVFV
jgi:hypothetical protein